MYKYHAVKLPSGKWSSSYGTRIGTIVPGEGFIPNENYEKEMEQTKDDEEPEKPGETKRPNALKPQKPASKAVLTHPEGFTSLEYGQYGLLFNLSRDIYAILKRHFSPVQAAQMYCYALILCTRGFCQVSIIDAVYQGSVLAIAFPECPLPMEAENMNALLQALDEMGEPVQAAWQDILALGIRPAEHKRWVNEIYRRGDMHYYWEGIHFEQSDAGPGLRLILLAAATVLSRLSKAVRGLHKSSISTADVLLAAETLRLSLEGDTWELRNALPKEMELLRQVGFVPRVTVSTREELL